MINFDIYYPIFDNIGEPSILLDMIFNPYYPDHVKWRCNASRKFVRRRRCKK